MARYNVEVMLTVAVEINDEDVITRCIDNHDDSGAPRPDQPGSRGWRNMYYDLDTRNKVIEHLAYNFAINNANISQLDGWADLPSNAATGHIDFWEALSVDEVALR